MIELGENNVDGVVDVREKFVDSFDFNKYADDRSLGRDEAMRVVQGISDRASAEQRGGEIQWDETEPKINKWKDKKYGVDQPNLGTGQLFSQKFLYGRITIAPEMVTMIYGVGEPPEKAAFGGTVTAADKKVTDIETLYYAHTGQSVHKIKRPLYELDDTISRQVQDRIAEALNDHIAEENAKRGL